jgi:hypothetical protein
MSSKRVVGRSKDAVVGLKIVRTPKQVGRMLQAKLYNRRIKCRLLTDGSYEFSFKRYVPNQEIQRHGMRLTEEALCTMLQMVAQIKQANPKENRTGHLVDGPVPPVVQPPNPI